jgi:hypothetical protein
MAFEGRMGQMEMKCIFEIGKNNISLWAKISQVSDLAHGPLVCFSSSTPLLLWQL